MPWLCGWWGHKHLLGTCSSLLSHSLNGCLHMSWFSSQTFLMKPWSLKRLVGLRLCATLVPLSVSSLMSWINVRSIWYILLMKFLLESYIDIYPMYILIVKLKFIVFLLKIYCFLIAWLNMSPVLQSDLDQVFVMYLKWRDLDTSAIRSDVSCSITKMQAAYSSKSMNAWQSYYI